MRPRLHLTVKNCHGLAWGQSVVSLLSKCDWLLHVELVLLMAIIAQVPLNGCYMPSNSPLTKVGTFPVSAGKVSLSVFAHVCSMQRAAGGCPGAT